jgi:hydrogenase/urease accessory protein HupE
MINGFVGGVLHPLMVPAHVLALLALGLLIGQRTTRRPLLLIAFGMGLTTGLAAIALAFRQTAAADVLLAVTAVTAVLAAVARPLPGLVHAALAVTGALALGMDSPPQAISLAVATVTMIGTGVGATLALAILAICIGHLSRDWQRIGIRIVSSWIAASAILVLALRFARGQLL